MADDCLILGGGVIGLSLAYELAGHGMRVKVVDRAEPARAASWAGAGILPAANLRTEDPPAAQLAGLSLQLHAEWAEQLRSETGIDTGYRKCGGIHLALHPADTDRLSDQQQTWREAGIRVERLDAKSLAECEPNVATGSLHAACCTPDEAQLRNPRHLKALLNACHRRGVTIAAGTDVVDFSITGSRIAAAITPNETLRAGQYCLATGSWSRGIAGRVGSNIRVHPVRGQMVLLRCDRPPAQHVINHGLRYIVPRDDGRVLVGATMENAGFSTQVTAGGVAGLLQLAIELIPDLASAPIERTWAGLRPGTADQLPYLGRLTDVDNGFIAAGHFRSGLFLSTGTAVAMSQLIRGERPEIDLYPLRVDR